MSQPPIAPLVDVMVPVIVADVAVSAPPDVTTNVPLPMFRSPPVIEPRSAEIATALTLSLQP
jgi:hypothetical protein